MPEAVRSATQARGAHSANGTAYGEAGRRLGGSRAPAQTWAAQSAKEDGRARARQVFQSPLMQTTSVGGQVSKAPSWTLRLTNAARGLHPQDPAAAARPSWVQPGRRSAFPQQMLPRAAMTFKGSSLIHSRHPQVTPGFREPVIGSVSGVLSWPPTFVGTAELRRARAATCAGNARPAARIACRPRRETCCSRQGVPISHKGEHLAVRHFPTAAEPRRLSFRYVSSCKVSCLVQPCSLVAAPFSCHFCTSLLGAVCFFGGSVLRWLFGRRRGRAPAALPTGLQFRRRGRPACSQHFAPAALLDKVWPAHSQPHLHPGSQLLFSCILSANPAFVDYLHICNRASLHAHILTLSRLPP